MLTAVGQVATTILRTPEKEISNRMSRTSLSVSLKTLLQTSGLPATGLSTDRVVMLLRESLVEQPNSSPLFKNSRPESKKQPMLSSTKMRL